MADDRLREFIRPPLHNAPALWQGSFPWPTCASHKYDRGHAIVFGGGWQSTGASKLAASAALRSGAGLVSIACDTQSLPIYASSLQSVMTKMIDTAADFAELIQDSNVKAVLIGPGAGLTDHTKECVLQTLLSRKPAVLDADALRLFSGTPTQLFDVMRAPCILTPHAGEFDALFSFLPKEEDRVDVVMQAASLSKAVVVLKGFHTLIASPDRRVAINENATPFLATAGTGDVLAGICTGLLAQGMPAFEAACAAVWLHSEAARRFGPGLIAEDIPGLLPNLLNELYGAHTGQ